MLVFKPMPSKTRVNCSSGGGCGGMANGPSIHFHKSRYVKGSQRSSAIRFELAQASCERNCSRIAIRAIQICVRMALALVPTKVFSLSGLLECFEEEFDLPAFAIDGFRGGRGQVMTVGREHQARRQPLGPSRPHSLNLPARH